MPSNWPAETAAGVAATATRLRPRLTAFMAGFFTVLGLLLVAAKALPVAPPL
jgi:hypothetical protein